jgi:hypothetical protein
MQEGRNQRRGGGGRGDRRKEIKEINQFLISAAVGRMEGSGSQHAVMRLCVAGRGAAAGRQTSGSCCDDDNIHCE